MFGLTLSHILTLITQYGYIIIFPIAVVEGPIISILAGFLVSLGTLNFILSLMVLMLGDMVGDSLYYAAGRWGEKTVRKHGKIIGITEERLEQTKKYFSDNHHKAVIVSKVAHGVGFTGLIMAGILKVPYRRYIWTCFYITFIQVIIFLTIGVFFGHAYVVLQKYLNYFTATVSIIALTIALLFGAYKIKNSKIFLK